MYKIVLFCNYVKIFCNIIYVNIVTKMPFYHACNIFMFFYSKVIATAVTSFINVIFKGIVHPKNVKTMTFILF